MIDTFYLCLLAVLVFHSIFFSLVIKVHRASEEEEDPSLAIKIPRSI